MSANYVSPTHLAPEHRATVHLAVLLGLVSTPRHWLLVAHTPELKETIGKVRAIIGKCQIKEFLVHK